MRDHLTIGDKILNSPVGPGELTGVTERGYPQVNQVAVGWCVAYDGTTFGNVPIAESERINNESHRRN